MEEVMGLFLPLGVGVMAVLVTLMLVDLFMWLVGSIIEALKGLT